MAKMTIERPFVSPDVKEVVKKLRSEGMEPTVDDVCWLRDLTRDQVDEHSLISLPVVIPNGYIDGTDIVIPRITSGVRMWWHERGRAQAVDAFAGDQERVVMSLAWALASRLGKALVDLTVSKLRSEVVTWIWAVSASPEIVSVALLRAMGENVSAGIEEVEIKGYDPKASEKTGYDPACVLSGIYGVPVDRLIWEYSEISRSTGTP